MSDYNQYCFHRAGEEADRLIERIKDYLSTRRAADWGFFLAGIVLGGLLL